MKLLSFPMSKRARAISILSTMLLLLDGIAGEAFHTETVIVPGSGATLARHACGAKEHHIPIDRMHACAACLASIEGIALPPRLRGFEAVLPASAGAQAQPPASFPFIHSSASSRAPPGHS